MADAVVFQIEDGVLAFEVVDKSAAGYADDWQAPDGKDVTTVTLADYDSNSQSWSCQTTSGALNATADTTTQDVPATFCNPAKSVPTPGETSFTLDAEFLQDPNVKMGLSRFLFEHDTEEAYFMLGLDDANPPKAIGRLRVQAGAFGGAARSTLTATLSLPLSRRPQIAYGTAADSEAVPPTGEGSTPATGATAGTPGEWTPTGSTPPLTVADLQAGSITASPTTAWTTGQWVQTGTAGTAGQAYWDGAAWVAGQAP